MIPFLSIRYSFSRSSGHRRRALRIVFSASLSLAVLMITISVMDYLQEGRFERIREARSFDMVISGNAVSEMKERYRDASVFLYGETEVLADGGVYTLRYIDASYDGALRIIYGDNTSLLVPYSLYMASDVINMTALETGRSGVVLPVTRKVEISGAFSTALGYSFDSSLLFMPLSSMPEGIKLYTAVKGVSDSECEKLRAEGYECISWKEKETGLYSAFILEKIMMYIVLSLLFVVILVSAASSIRTFFSAREKERAELIILGLGKWKADCVFLLSMLFMMLIGIVLGLVLTHVLIPLGERYTASFAGSGADLEVPYRSFIVFSTALLFFIALFSIREERMLDRRPLEEVIKNE